MKLQIDVTPRDHTFIRSEFLGCDLSGVAFGKPMSVHIMLHTVCIHFGELCVTAIGLLLL